MLFSMPLLLQDHLQLELIVSSSNSEVFFRCFHFQKSPRNDFIFSLLVVISILQMVQITLSAGIIRAHSDTLINQSWFNFYWWIMIVSSYVKTTIERFSAKFTVHTPITINQIMLMKYLQFYKLKLWEWLMTLYASLPRPSQAKTVPKNWSNRTDRD